MKVHKLFACGKGLGKIKELAQQRFIQTRSSTRNLFPKLFVQLARCEEVPITC